MFCNLVYNFFILHSAKIHHSSTDIYHCREDEFDLDLEDIMVIEAIWLSIQVNLEVHILSIQRLDLEFLSCLVDLKLLLHCAQMVLTGEWQK